MTVAIVHSSCAGSGSLESQTPNSKSAGSTPSFALSQSPPPTDTERAPTEPIEKDGGERSGDANHQPPPSESALPNSSETSVGRHDSDPDPERPKITEAFLMVFHVATANSEVANERIDQFLGIANTHFAGASTAFRIEARRELPEEFIVLETIRERHQLKRYFVKRRINVFLVDGILDPVPSQATRRASRWQGRKPSGRLAGAHIVAKNNIPDTYILLSGQARDISLTHELGHFFGLPHKKASDNIMSYGTDRTRFLDEQLQVIERRARKLKKKRIVETAEIGADDQ